MKPRKVGIEVTSTGSSGVADCSAAGAASAAAGPEAGAATGVASEGAGVAAFCAVGPCVSIKCVD